MAILKNSYTSGDDYDYDRDMVLRREQEACAKARRDMQLRDIEGHRNAMAQQGMQQGRILGAMQPGIQEQYSKLYNAASQNNPGSFKIVNKVDPNTEPAMQVSLIAAHTLWAAKWGWDWLSIEKLQDAPGDLRWNRLAERMHSARMTEFDRLSSCYKLIPVGNIWKS